MRRQTLLVLAIMVMVDVQCDAEQAKQQQPSKTIPDTIERPIRAVLPEAFRAFATLPVGSPDSSVVNGALGLVEKSRHLVVARGSVSDEQDDICDAYTATWALVAVVRQKTTDEQVRRAVLRAWDDSLMDDAYVHLQVRSLDDFWDRDLLTPRFWELLASSGNQSTISSICYVIAKHGSKEDAGRLRAKLASATNPQIRQIVQSGLTWMDYWHSNRKDPGPAVLPPRP